MATDLTLTMPNNPGAIAQLGEAAEAAGLNLDGIAGSASGAAGDVHVLVEDAGRAREAFESAGLEVSGERPVLVVDVQDRPGELGRVARRIADAGVNIDLIYLATNTRLVIGSDDVEKAREALGQ